jgi:hypothetical protein
MKSLFSPIKDRQIPHKSERTGEDIDMLHEKEKDSSSDENNTSYRYRDNYDAA